MSWRVWGATLARVGLAVVFAVAGWSKVTDLAGSGRAVNAYQLLPFGLAKVVGAGLPFVELALALVLLVGLATRFAAAVATVLLVVYIVGTLATRTQIILIGAVGQRTLSRMRSEIFATMQRLSLRFFDRHPAGDLMSRLVNDTDVLNQLFSQGIIQVLGSLFGLVGILIAMLAPWVAP